MAKEIERKFLVEGDFMPYVTSSSHIEQGYIAKSDSLTLRVRTRDDKGYLTIKGRSNEAGMSRDEWEYEIPVEEARELLRFSRGTIDKTRYLVPAGRHTFEVDRFYGANKGLIVEFERPAWLGREVTGDRRYYNSQLLKKPFLLWEE